MSCSYCFLSLFALILVLEANEENTFHNEFALCIPDGNAEDVGRSHGLVLLGRIFKDYYLFMSPRLGKRSLKKDLSHSLDYDPRIHWYEQQKEHKRVKRGFEAALPGDPLFPQQWFINNGAHDGSDMNVIEAWKMGITGKKVVVTILDDGIQSNHPDLAANYDPLASTDINSNDDDPMPRDNGDNKHGTRCAGEVAAVAFNRYCGVGIAYNASVGGVRMLDGEVNDAVEARALSLNPNHIDIYSASWGPEDDGRTVDGPGHLAKEAFINGIANGRQGKGSIYVWASGNGGRRNDNCNCDGYTNSIFTLSISSATQGGNKPWYLEECSSTLSSTYSSGTPSHDASITTVDQDGKLRPEKLCTSTHTGTSASAPIAAGVCALALEANPALTWRDMQYLVVLTSNPFPLMGESGWAVNGVGRHYSHKFGYGLMDAGAIVKAAINWNPAGPQIIFESKASFPNKTLNKDKMEEVIHSKIYIEDNEDVPRYLEHVQAVVSVSGSPRGSLEITLISPYGTRSKLLMKRSKDNRDGSFDDWPFLSVHFWGENPIGDWILEVKRHEDIEHTLGDKIDGFFRTWKILFFGVKNNPVNDENLTFKENFSNLGESLESYEEYENHLHNEANDDSMELDCDPECKYGCVGAGPENCVHCKNLVYRKTCVENCPNKTYPVNGICRWCHSKCHTCYGPGPDNCLDCLAPLFFVRETSSCHKQCPKGYFTRGNLCIPCKDKSICLSCRAEYGSCRSCRQGLLLFEKKGECLIACPEGFYSNSTGVCLKCHSDCKDCSGPKASQCSTCKDGFYYYERSCSIKCPLGHYKNEITKECTPCSRGCLNCERDKCIFCEEDWTLDHFGRCAPKIALSCSENQYFDTRVQKCSPCHCQCETCFGRGLDQCLSCRESNHTFLHISSCLDSCPKSFTFPEFDRKCTHCPHSCRSCFNAKKCTTCHSGYFLTNDGRCVVKCAKGYFPSSDSKKCEPCHRTCKSCSGHRYDNCLSCLIPYILTLEGSCRLKCPQGSVLSGERCLPCHGRCKTCDGLGAENCFSCKKGFKLEVNTCFGCKSGEYFDEHSKECSKCHQACKQCSGDRQSDCISCKSPSLVFNKWNNTCVKCCQDTVSSRGCCECNKARTHCISPLLSLSRKRSFSQLDSNDGETLKRPYPKRDAKLLYVFSIVTLIFVFGVYFVRRNRFKCRNKRTQHRYTRVNYENQEEYLNEYSDEESYEDDINRALIKSPECDKRKITRIS